ncbi:MAG TPA: TIGR04086 family membrane protein [Pseudogracilibacillus sp.]|nr:TIGR04086 family membrane protein [Pseudogracilibacillus sp.]
MNNLLMRAVFLAWLTIGLLLLISITVLAIIIRFSHVSEMTISFTALIIAFMILFISGLVAGIKGKANGLVLGLLTGSGFSLMTLIVQFLAFNDLFSLKQCLFHLAYILTTIVGSILGVNFAQLKQS